MVKSLDIKEILKIIPHRYPFLLIDRILELDEVKRKAVAIKNVTVNEPFFQGHFPGQPVMPGVLIVEAFAQVGVVMALSLKENEGKLVYFGGIDNARFRKPVVPGDQLRLELEIIWVRGPIGKAHAAAFVDQNLVAEGDFIFSIVEKEKGGVKIHPTATVHPSAILGKDVEIGAYTVIGPDVKIGDRTKVQQHCTILRWTTIGQDNQISQGVTIGAPPQDLKYKGEKVEVVIGDRNIIREYVAIHHPTGEGAKTIIGNDNFIMTHSHIPHNCRIGNGTILASFCGISGHAQIGDQVVIGGMVGLHQFVRIGRLAMIGGHSKITQDIPPFMLVDGNPAQVRGINSVGLKRRGISFESQSEIKKAFRLIYESGLNAAQAAKEIRQRLRPLPEIDQLASFLEEESARGISKKTAIDAEAEELIFPEIPELGI